MQKYFRSGYWFVLLLLLSGCSGGPETGPAEVRWDRDSCERCRMVLSDPHFAAQIRYFPEGKRSKVMKFDDIGCAVIWLQGTEWEQHEKTEIWVADYQSKDWIDARTATYIPRKTSPMEYGLGATAKASENGLTFEQAKAHIADVEQRFNVHGQQLKQRLQDQAKLREQQ